MVNASAALAAAVVVSFAAPAAALGSDLALRLDQAGKLLWEGYLSTRPAAGRTLVAVLPFGSGGSAPEIGALAAGLIAARLARQDGVVLVERATVNAWLRTGRGRAAISDPSSAAEAGAVLGADLALWGSVELSSGVWRVEARLLETRQGRVVSSCRTGLDEDDLEGLRVHYRPAAPVPGRWEAFLLYNYRQNRAGAPAEKVAALAPGKGQVQETVTPLNYDLHWLGLGARYVHRETWIMEASYAHLAARNDYSRTSRFLTWSGKPGEDSRDSVTDGSLLRATAARIMPMAGGLSLIAGAGLAVYRLALTGEGILFRAGPSLRAGLQSSGRGPWSLGLTVNWDFVDLNAPGSEFAAAAYSFEPSLIWRFR